MSLSRSLFRYQARKLDDSEISQELLALASRKPRWGFGKMDKVMGELKAIREEQAVQGHHLSDHEDRIEKIESNLGLS
jgi:hypothetical protein